MPYKMATLAVDHISAQIHTVTPSQGYDVRNLVGPAAVAVEAILTAVLARFRRCLMGIVDQAKGNSDAYSRDLRYVQRTSWSFGDGQWSVSCPSCDRIEARPVISITIRDSGLQALSAGFR